jgi:uncharacterized protein YndB with AHSA1/START domain
MNVATNMNNAEPLVLGRIFDAPIETIWRVITNPEQLNRWNYGSNPRVSNGLKYLSPGG